MNILGNSRRVIKRVESRMICLYVSPANLVTATENKFARNEIGYHIISTTELPLLDICII